MKDLEIKNWMFVVVGIVALLMLFNQYTIFSISSSLGGGSSGGILKSAAGGASLSLKGGEGVTFAPVLLAPGESPVISGYRTKVKQLPTISLSPQKAKTGDPQQDAVNLLIPTGTPDYGQAAGVSFDDPIVAQRVWGSYEQSIQLSPEQQQRWQGIVGVFTCDYCCGSPEQPTIITQCGCAHAHAWRGMAKWMIQNYGDKVTDEQIMGEMSKWKALWYPGPTISRVLQEQSLSGGGGSAPVKLDQLPNMVGGC